MYFYEINLTKNSRCKVFNFAKHTVSIASLLPAWPRIMFLFAFEHLACRSLIAYLCSPFFIVAKWNTKKTKLYSFHRFVRRNSFFSIHFPAFLIHWSNFVFIIQYKSTAGDATIVFSCQRDIFIRSFLQETGIFLFIRQPAGATLIYRCTLKILHLSSNGRQIRDVYIKSRERMVDERD